MRVKNTLKLADNTNKSSLIVVLETIVKLINVCRSPIFERI